MAKWKTLGTRKGKKVRYSVVDIKTGKVIHVGYTYKPIKKLAVKLFGV